MKNTCARSGCSRTALSGKRFCSTTCRNIYVSELMTKRVATIKKKYGNKYYVSGKGFKFILYYA